MGRKCAVDGCLSESNRPEDIGVTFHKVPLHNDIRPKWLSLCHIPDFKIKVIYICSRHFLRADFCNFKGKKYMLRQGILPSVFPWDKSKLEAIKNTTTKKSSDDAITDQLPDDPFPIIKQEINQDDVTSDDTVLHSVAEDDEIKVEQTDDSDIIKTEVKQEDDVVAHTTKINEPNREESSVVLETPKSAKEIVEKHNIKSPPDDSFGLYSRIEALDFNNEWYPARIIEEDYEENEVLIHFEKFSNKYDEWICKDSPRLRTLQSAAAAAANKKILKYVKGERCMAMWSDGGKFPATVTNVLSNDLYEVLFDDGYVKNVKSNRMCKIDTINKPIQSSPLFDPIKSTKQERRDKKRKLNVAQLFGKRQKIDYDDKSIPRPTPDSFDENTVFPSWVPGWHDNGKPIGIPSSIDAIDGSRKSTIVPDPRLPDGWTKHIVQRTQGLSAGKWDTVIISPDNRRFRTRSEIKSYLSDTKLMTFNWTMFDFSVTRNRNRRRELELDLLYRPSKVAADVAAAAAAAEGSNSIVEDDVVVEDRAKENVNYLKIPIVDDAYRCPIEGCDKTYRRENLAQMHVKHYHPEYTKYLDSTPNVADLAYARTVGESLDKSLSSTSTTPKLTTKTINTKTNDLINNKTLKDAEIIKLLNNTKPFDEKIVGDETIQPIPSGLPSNMYPDINLKDLLNKSEGIPKQDDKNMNLKVLSTTRPPIGIKTLLPVVRGENNNNNNKSMMMMTPTMNNNHHRSTKSSSNNLKRKRGNAVANSRTNSHGNNNNNSGLLLLNESIDDNNGNCYNNNINNNAKGKEICSDNTQILPIRNTQLPQQQQTINEPNNIIIEGGEIIRLVKMKQEEIINCVCGFVEEDGLMVQCDLCLCWQHGYCINIERESQVPDSYVCYICLNPYRQRASTKYLNDQEWLKQGTLPSTKFNSNYYNYYGEDVQRKQRFDILKKTHDLSGGLFELKDFVNTLKVKLNIAEEKNHPKLYLWSKPYEKSTDTNNIDTTKEMIMKQPLKLEDIETDNQSHVKVEMPTNNNVDDNSSLTPKSEQQPNHTDNDSMLMMILKGQQGVGGNNKEDLIQKPSPVPQPETAIDSGDCRLNLLDHIVHAEALVSERLDQFEQQISELEEMSGFNDNNCDTLRIKQTLHMLLKDLNTVQELSHMTTL